MERKLNDFNDKEKKAMQIKAERLLHYATAVVDGTGSPEINANDFEVELHDLYFMYENLKKYKGRQA